MTEGVLLAKPDAEIWSTPLSDGGEGTMEILTKQANGVFIDVSVRDPLARVINAQYGFSKTKSTAFVEMAVASGLLLLKTKEYNPLLTSTYGTGQLIKDAIEKGAKKIILGIGGSATTDGGIGMAAALGYRFYDENELELPTIGGSLHQIRSIDTRNVDSRIFETEIVVACDVTNPLFGENGAAFVYGPQKGASPDMVKLLDSGLKNLNQVAIETFAKDCSLLSGAGAAGGLGAGSIWFLNATLRAGIGIVMDEVNISKHIKNADLVISGEGKIDHQTLQGKVIKGLAELCQKHQVPFTVLCGTLAISTDELQKAGITYASSVLNRPMTLEIAQTEAYMLVKDATIQLVRLFCNLR